MFEHRLGLALSLSLQEVRTLPYPEYRSWQLFYKLEPWGWHDEEYRTAVLLTMMHNVNATKKSEIHKVPDYMRDLAKAMLKEVKKQEIIVTGELSEREKEIIRAQAKKDFGIL